MLPDTISIPAPLCGIRFIVLTDGTVFENRHYECHKRLTHDEYEAIFDHVTTLLCGNIPDGTGLMAKSFKDAGV